MSPGALALGLSQKSQGRSPFDLGVSVIVVSVKKIEKGKNPDWFGPYYKAYVTFSNPNTGDSNNSTSPDQSYSFGANGGCSDCWQGTYSVPSSSLAYFSLRLVDDQGWWGGGEKPVNIAGESSLLQLAVNPSIGYIGGTSLSASSMDQTDDGFTFEKRFSGSSGDRTAVVTLRVTASSDLQHQTWLRYRTYEEYAQLMQGASGAWAQEWLRQWDEHVKQLRSQLFPLLMTSFGLMTLPLDMAVGMVALDLLPDWEDLLGDVVQEVLQQAVEDWVTATRQFSSANLTLPDLGGTDIANITLAWNWCNDGKAARVYELTYEYLGKVSGEKSALRNNDRNGIANSLDRQLTALSTITSTIDATISKLQSRKQDNRQVCDQSGTDYLIEFFEGYKRFVETDGKYLQETLNLLNPPAAAKKTHPKVEWVAPKGTIGVNTPITLGFSDAMDKDSIWPKSLEPTEYPIQPPETYSLFNFAWSADGRQLTLTPVYRLDYGKNYTVTLTERITDQEGTSLERFTFGFQTEVGPATPTATFYQVSINSEYGRGAVSTLRRGEVYAAKPTSLDYWTVKRSLGPTVEAVFRTNDTSARFECRAAESAPPGVIEHSGQGFVGEYQGKLYFVPLGRDCPSFFVLELLDRVSPLPTVVARSSAILEIKRFEGNIAIAEQVGLRPGAEFRLEPIALQEYSAMGTDIGSGVLRLPGSPLDGKELRIYGLFRDQYTVIPDKPQAAFAIKIIPEQPNWMPTDFVVYSAQRETAGAWRLLPNR